MNQPAIDLSRRGFLALFGGALALGFNVGCGGAQARMIRHADQTGELVPNMFITVKRDGRIGLALHKAEFGQGVSVGYSTLVAEELDVPIESVDFHFADSLPEYRTTLFLQNTGGSASMKEAYFPLRRAAASAREMLVAAAAADWGVPPSACSTDGGHVLHKETNRRAAYGDLTLKAAHLPVPAEPKLKAPSEFKRIGKQSRRVDSRPKVDGSARFGIDVVLPNMAKALVIHAPVYGGEPKTCSAEAAKKMPGVIDVFPFRWGVAVVAEKYWQALAASRAVLVTWTSGDVAGLDSEKLRAAARSFKKDGAASRDDGNVDKAMAAAATKIEATYEMPFLAHATMEPQNCTVHVKGDKVEVWAPSQNPTILQAYVADAVGVAHDDVLVHTTFMGGAFGRRALGDWAAQAALIAKRIHRPVQMIWSRESDMTQAFFRPQATAHMRGALSADGTTATAFASHLIAQSIALDTTSAVRAMIPGVPRGIQNTLIDSLKGMVGSNTVPDMFATEGMADTRYAIPNLKVEFTPVRTALPVCSWRSVGNSITGFLVEGFIDELARAGKQDPLEFRRRMLGSDERAKKTLDAVAKLSKWGTRAAGIGRGVARHFCFGTEVAEVADVEIVDGRIKVRRVYAAVECGIVVNPDIVRAQVEGAIIFGLSAALHQEITIAGGVVQQTNFDSFPLLRMNEAPEIFVDIVPSDRDPSGIGEPGLPPIAPAVANAVFDLTGVRLRRTPLQSAWDEVHRG